MIVFVAVAIHGGQDFCPPDRKRKRHSESELRLILINAQKAALSSVNYWSDWQIMKAYHLMGPKGQCEDVSISVTVEGTVSYTGEP